MQRTLSAKEYEAMGAKYYNARDYEKAVLAYTDAMEMTRSLDIELLDRRAAAYVKMEDFNAAKRDGRDMIKGFPTNPKGYLRTGSILEQENEKQKALGIYKLGVKRADKSNPRFPLLMNAQDKLSEPSAPHSADPLAAFPKELADLVISYLNYKEVTRCLRVSKGWKKYLLSSTQLWQTLDLSLTRRAVTTRAFRACLTRARNEVHTATIHHFHDTDLLCKFIRNSKQLKSIHILSAPPMSRSLIDATSHAPLLQKFIYNAETTLDTVTEILNHQPHLSHVEFTTISVYRTPSQFHPLPHLKILNLTASTVQPRLQPKLDHGNLLAMAPGLEQLTLSGFGDGPQYTGDYTSLHKLTHLSLLRHEVMQFPLLPPTLTHLTFGPTSWGHRASNGAPWYDTALRCRLPHLTHLSLHGAEGLVPFFFECLLLRDLFINEHDIEDSEDVNLETATRLTEFRLMQCDLESGSVLDILSNPRIGTPELQRLGLVEVGVSDEELEKIPTLVPGLVEVDLTKTLITGAGVRALVDGLAGLKRMVLLDCQEISSYDVVEYARGKGIRVEVGSRRK